MEALRTGGFESGIGVPRATSLRDLWLMRLVPQTGERKRVRERKSKGEREKE